MAVPMVLATTARRSWILCSSSGRWPTIASAIARTPCWSHPVAEGQTPGGAAEFPVGDAPCAARRGDGGGRRVGIWGRDGEVVPAGGAQPEPPARTSRATTSASDVKYDLQV